MGILLARWLEIIVYQVGRVFIAVISQFGHGVVVWGSNKHGCPERMAGVFLCGKDAYFAQWLLTSR
jgi:hypothetical protein